MKNRFSITNQSNVKDSKNKSFSLSPCSSYTSYKQMMNIRKKHKLMSKREKTTLIPELWIKSCDNVRDVESTMLENQKISEFLKNKMCVPSRDSDLSKISKRFSKPPIQTKIVMSSKTTDANSNLENSVHIDSVSGNIDQTYNFNLKGTENLNFNLPTKLDNVESKMSGTINPNQEMKVSIRYKTDNDLESIKDLSENLAVLNQAIDRLNEPLAKEENEKTLNDKGENVDDSLKLKIASDTVNFGKDEDDDLENQHKDNMSEHLSNFKMTTRPVREHSSVYMYNFEKYNTKSENSTANVVIMQEQAYLYTSKNHYQNNTLLNEMEALNSASRASLLEDAKGHLSDQGRVSLPNTDVRNSFVDNRLSNQPEVSQISSDPDVSIIITTTLSHSQPIGTKTEVFLHQRLLNEAHDIMKQKELEARESMARFDNIHKVISDKAFESKLISKDDNDIMEQLNRFSLRNDFQDKSLSQNQPEIEQARSQSKLANDFIVDSDLTKITVKEFEKIASDLDNKTNLLANNFVSTMSEDRKAEVDKFSQKSQKNSLKIISSNEKNNLVDWDQQIEKTSVTYKKTSIMIDNGLNEELIAGQQKYGSRESAVDLLKSRESSQLRDKDIGFNEIEEAKTSLIDLAQTAPESPTTNYNIRSSALSVLIEQPLPLHNAISPVEFKELDDISLFKSIKVTENKTLNDYTTDRQLLLHYKIPEDKYQPISLDAYADKALSKSNRHSDSSHKSKTSTFNNEIIAVISELNIQDDYLKKIVNDIEKTDDKSIFGRSMKALDNYVEYNSNTYREWKSLNKESIYIHEKFLRSLSLHLYKLQMGNQGRFENEDTLFSLTEHTVPNLKSLKQTQSNIDQQFLMHPKLTDDLYRPINAESFADKELTSAIQYVRSTTSRSRMSMQNPVDNVNRRQSSMSTGKKREDSYLISAHDKNNSEPLEIFDNEPEQSGPGFISISSVVEARTYNDKNTSRISIKKVESIKTNNDHRYSRVESLTSRDLRNANKIQSKSDYIMNTAEQVDDLTSQVSKEQNESPKFYSTSACSAITDSNDNMSEKASSCKRKGKKPRETDKCLNIQDKQTKPSEKPHGESSAQNVDEKEHKFVNIGAIVDINGKLSMNKDKGGMTKDETFSANLPSISTEKDQVDDLNELIEKSKHDKHVRFAEFFVVIYKLSNLSQMEMTKELLDDIENDLKILEKSGISALSLDSIKRLANFAYFNKICTISDLSNEEFIRNGLARVGEMRSKQDTAVRDRKEDIVVSPISSVEENSNKGKKGISDNKSLTKPSLVNSANTTTIIENLTSSFDKNPVKDQVNFATTKIESRDDTPFVAHSKASTSEDYTALVSELMITDKLLSRIDHNMEVLNSQSITLMSNSSLESLNEQKIISNGVLNMLKDQDPVLHTPSTKRSIIKPEVIGYVPKIRSLSIPIARSSISPERRNSVLEILSESKYAVSSDKKVITEDILVQDGKNVSVTEISLTADSELRKNSLSSWIQQANSKEDFNKEIYDEKVPGPDNEYVEVSKIQINLEDDKTETEIEISLQKKVHRPQAEVLDEYKPVEGRSSYSENLTNLDDNSSKLQDQSESETEIVKLDNNEEMIKLKDQENDDQQGETEGNKDEDFDSRIDQRILDDVQEFLLDSLCNDLCDEKCRGNDNLDQEPSPSYCNEESDQTDHCSVSTLIDLKTKVCLSSKVPVKISKHQEDYHLKLYRSGDRRKNFRLCNTIYKKTELTIPHKYIKECSKNVKAAQNAIIKNQECKMYNKLINEVIDNCFKKPSKCCKEDSLTCRSDSSETIYEYMVPIKCQKNQNPDSVVKLNRGAKWPSFTKKKSDCIKIPLPYHKDDYRSEIPLKSPKKLPKDTVLSNTGDFEIPPGGIFGRDIHEPKFTNFCCNICRMWINLGNRQIHMDECSKLNRSISKETSRPKLKPRAIKRMPGVVCYVCGRRFTTHSILIHEKSCLCKWNKINCALRKGDRKPIPTKPNFSEADIEKYVQEQKSQGKTDYCSEDAINDLTFISSRNHIFDINE